MNANEIFDLKEEQEKTGVPVLTDYLNSLTKEEKRELIVGIFEFSLAGTCMQTAETVMDDYGLQDIWMEFSEDEQILMEEESTFVCCLCGWNCYIGEEGIHIEGQGTACVSCSEDYDENED